MDHINRSEQITRPKGNSYVILLSGGLDSSVLAYSLYSLGVKLKGLTLDYGQRHIAERVAAQRVADLLGIEHQVVSLREVTPLFGNECSLVTDHFICPGERRIRS